MHVRTKCDQVETRHYIKRLMNCAMVAEHDFIIIFIACKEIFKLYSKQKTVINKSCHDFKCDGLLCNFLRWHAVAFFLLFVNEILIQKNLIKTKATFI